MAFQRFLASTALLSILPCLLGADTPPSAELKLADQSLQSTLEKLDPKAKVEYKDESLSVAYLPQKFKIHSVSKSGQISLEAHDKEGPSYKGFVLHIYLQPKGEVNQAITPQTIRQPYWETYLDVTPLPNSDKQLYWALSYGCRTDNKLLAAIHKNLRELGESPRKAVKTRGAGLILRNKLR